jgi:hypothetical protein
MQKDHMTVIDSTMEEVSCSLVDERRSPLHNIQAATPFPISSVRQNIGTPVRVAWHQLSSSGMLGIVFLARSRGWVESALCDLDPSNFAPQIQIPDSLDVNRHRYGGDSCVEK